MSSSTEALAQLNKWRNESTELFMCMAISTVNGWCVGTLTNPPPELQFVIAGIDGKDFSFWISVHPTYNPRFKFIDAREGLPFRTPQRERDEFGKVLEVSLQVDEYGESKGRGVFAEVS
jgi:hypothetical protein